MQEEKNRQLSGRFNRRARRRRIFRRAYIATMIGLSLALMANKNDPHWGHDTNIFDDIQRSAALNIILPLSYGATCLSLDGELAGKGPEFQRIHESLSVLEKSWLGSELARFARDTDIYLCDGAKTSDTALGEFRHMIGAVDFRSPEDAANTEIVSHELHHGVQFYQYAGILQDFESYRSEDVIRLVMGYEFTANTVALMVGHQLARNGHPEGWTSRHDGLSKKSHIHLRVRYTESFAEAMKNGKDEYDADMAAARAVYQAFYDPGAFETRLTILNQGMETLMGMALSPGGSKSIALAGDELEKFGQLPDGNSFTAGLDLPEMCDMADNPWLLSQALAALDAIRFGIPFDDSEKSKERYGIFNHLDIKQAARIQKSGATLGMVLFSMVAAQMPEDSDMLQFIRTHKKPNHCKAGPGV